MVDISSQRYRLHVEQEDVADPAPLGLGSFALTTFVLSANNAGWAPGLVWISLALFYGGTAQFAAGMWEFRKNNTFGATAFTTYGGFWLSLGIFFVFLQTGVIPADTFPVLDALGWFAAGFFIFTFYMSLCALMLSKAVLLVFVLLDITFLTLFIGFFSNEGSGAHASWTKAGGYFGIFTAAAAWYASFAVCFNQTARREIIPLGSPFIKFSRDDRNITDGRSAVLEEEGKIA